MKKIFLIFLIFFLISNAAALSITLPEKIDQGGTLIATLQGNILDHISKTDVSFYEGNVQIPLNYDIEKIEDTYYIYAIIPYSEKKYSLIINDVYFKENNQFKTLDLEANFSISNKTADFNVNPGFIITNQKYFQIEVYNNLNSNLEITYNFPGISESTTIPLQESKIIKINTSKVLGTSKNNLIIKSSNMQYDLPIYVIKNQTIPPINESNNVSDGTIPVELEGRSRLQFSADGIDEKLRKGEIYEYVLGLANIGDKESGRIELIISEEIKNLIDLETISINNLLPNEDREIRFLINTNLNGEFNGAISAESEDSIEKLEIFLLIAENVVPITSIRSELTCEELDGTVCLPSQICSGTTVFSANEACCKGSCKLIDQPKEEKKKYSTVSIILVVVALLIILVAIFLGFKKSKARKQNAIIEPS